MNYRNIVIIILKHQCTTISNSGIIYKLTLINQYILIAIFNKNTRSIMSCIIYKLIIIYFEV